MYKIFINEVAVYLVSEQKWRQVQSVYLNESAQEYHHVNKDFDFGSFIEKAESAEHQKDLLLIHQNLQELKDLFFSNYTIVLAAGGVVLNEKDEVLIIFRRGMWDLPKGKVDKGETIPSAAKREVLEETGLEEVEMIKPVYVEDLDQETTLHTYFEKGKRILKETYWYEMRSRGSNDTVPEAREGIEKAIWVKRNELEPYYHKTYRSLQDIIGKYLL